MSDYTVKALRGTRKPLRPPSAGRAEIRILLIFDPWRSAILLVADDKSGQWERWYRTAIPRAEQLCEDYHHGKPDTTSDGRPGVRWPNCWTPPPKPAKGTSDGLARR